MSDETDFNRILTLFDVLAHAHDHGLNYTNIGKAARKALDEIEESLAPRPVINIMPKATSAIEDTADDDADDDEENDDE